MKTNAVSPYHVYYFLENVGKLDKNVHKRTSDAVLGTVRLVKSASETKNGKRLYGVSSKVIHPGCYTMASLRKAYAAKTPSMLTA